MTTATTKAPAASRARRARPPGPAGSPLLGCARELHADPLGLFARSAAEYGDLVCLPVAHRRVYLVVGPDLITQIGVRNRENYVKGVSYDALRIPMREALLTADGETWRRRRRLMLPLFSRRELLAQVPVIGTAVEATFPRWDELARSGEPFDAAVEMNRLAFDVIGRVLIGAALGGDMARLEALIDQASAWVARRTRALVPLPTQIPTPRNLRFGRAQASIRAFAEGLVDAGGHGGRDMISHLIAARGMEGEQLDRLQLRDEVIAFLMAGHQTTGAALAWTWYLLGQHADADERLAEEAARALDDGPPTAETLDRLPYTGQVVQEAMRLYPPGWAFTRTPLEDDELDGYTVPAGSVMVICSYANQRNPRFWDDPLRFDPARFAPDSGLPRNPYHYFPFGIGPTSCIGKHLAMMELKVAVAMLARRYRLELVSRGPVRPEPAITLTPRDPVMVRAHRRA